MATAVDTQTHVQQLARRGERLFDEQVNFRDTWQHLAEFFTPYKANILWKWAPGTRRTQRMFDSAGVIAAATLSSNMLGAVANQAQDWYSLRIRQDDLNELKPVRDWCEHITKRSLSALAASNFYTELSEVFVDLPIFAVGGLYIEERDPIGPNRWGGLQYTGLVIGQYAIAEDRMGRVDTVYRKFCLSAREVAAVDGWTPSPEVQDKAALDKRPDEPVELMHAVYRRPEADRRGGGPGQQLPFASCYYEVKTKQLLSEGGYEEFPYAVARWSKDSLSAYGWGPGAIAYPDVRTLNRYVELDLGARGKAVDPPLLVKHESVLGSLSLEPATINTVMDDEPARAVVPLASGAKFEASLEGMQRLEAKIDKIFFGPLMRDLDRQKTATEAWIIQDEVMRLLGPAAGRMQTELLGHAIERSLALMFRARVLPPPPPELLQAGFNADLDIVYEGPLARAQRSRDFVAIQRKNEWVAQVAAISPGVVDLFDWDAEARHIAEVVGYPSDLVLGDEQIAQIRGQKAAQQQAAAKLQLVGGAAQAAGAAAPMVKAMGDLQQQQQATGAQAA